MTNLTVLAEQAEAALAPHFAKIDEISHRNTARILDAFRANRVSAAHFASTDGYGYDDIGRDTFEKVFAEVVGAPAALVRTSILSGTHALAIGLFGLLRPGDIMLSLTGAPYDTLHDVIGISGKEGEGSLKDFGIEYREVALKDGRPDKEAIKEALIACKDRVKVAFIQRSKGYLDRVSLSSAEVGELVELVHAHTTAYAVVDNCYGEFVCESEPTAFGADLIIGSLIKNPGGGMAECGGYLAGTEKAVSLCANRYTTPGVGAEVGASLGQNKSLYKGLFYAPHTVAQALKTAAFAAYIFDALGMECSPAWDEERADIIELVRCGTREAVVAFCRGIQHGSPVDAYLTCEPWDMPGYNDPVIMAAGAFTQGASVELSADAPIRPPYIAYLQGALTYESGKYAILSAAKEVLEVLGK